MSESTIATRLIEAREMAGLSQRQVARELNIPTPSLFLIEAEGRVPSDNEVVEFAKLYHVSVSWLLGETAYKLDSDRFGGILSFEF